MGNLTVIIMATDNVVNRAIALLLQRMKSTGQNYWIFNTYTMSYLLRFPHDKDSLGSRLYKKLPKIIFKYDRLYCICNVGNMHWTVLTVNFRKKSIKYINSMSGKGTKYISSIMYWLDYEHMKLDRKKMIWDGWSVSNSFH